MPIGIAALLLFHSNSWIGNASANCPEIASTSGDQYDHTTLPLPFGGTLVAWSDLRNGDPDIALQRVATGGSFTWGADGVALRVSPGGQYAPALASDGLGGAILAYLDDYYGGVVAQRVNSSGARVWNVGGLPIGKVGFTPYRPGIVSDGAGGAIIAWANDGDIFAQRLAADGARLWGTAGVFICASANEQIYPSICSDENGGAIVIWQDSRASPQAIYAQRVSSSGAVLWQLNGTPIAVLGAANLGDAALVSDGDAGAFLAWTASVSTTRFVRVEKISSNGEPLWNSGGLSPVFGYSPALASDGTGGVFVAWSEGGNTVLTQRLTKDGTPYWPITSPANGTGQGTPKVVSDGLGGSFVTWTQSAADGSDIRAQRLDAANRRMWGSAGFLVCGAEGYQSVPVLAHDPAGSVFFVWENRTAAGRYRLGALGVPLDSPVPALVSLVSARSDFGAVRVTWFAPEPRGLLASVLRHEAGQDWQDLGSISPDGAGLLEFEDLQVVPGARYAYRLRYRTAGVEVVVPEVWVDVPVMPELAVRGTGHHPAASLTVSISLPTAAPAQLEAFDVTGRRLFTRDVGGYGPGIHVLDFSEYVRVSPGVYQLRLSQGAIRATTRLVVAR